LLLFEVVAIPRLIVINLTGSLVRQVSRCSFLPLILSFPP
jgi:hypothetical protein